MAAAPLPVRWRSGLLRRCSRWLGNGRVPRVIRLEALLPQPLLCRLMPFWLFERSCRPQNVHRQLRLLAWIQTHPSASPEQQGYALVARAYRAADIADHPLASTCLLDLQPKLTEALHQVRTGRHTGLNRENPVKWLVSLHTTAYHLGLMLDESQATLMQLQNLEQSITPTLMASLDADVACRVSSNLLRCLSLCWLEAWRQGDGDQLQNLDQKLKQVARDLTERHANHPRQTFHRQVAETLIATLDSLHPLRAGSAAAEPCLQTVAGELVRSSNPELAAKLVSWFRDPAH